MRGFINVTVRDGLRRLMPIDKIMSVCELANGRAFIQTELDGDYGYGFETLNYYDDVLDKIQEAMKIKISDGRNFAPGCKK